MSTFFLFRQRSQHWLYLYTAGNCNFDQNFCFWKNDLNSIFKWTLRRDRAPKYQTGPSGDHTSGTIDSLTFYLLFFLVEELTNLQLSISDTLFARPARYGLVFLLFLTTKIRLGCLVCREYVMDRTYH